MSSIAKDSPPVIVLIGAYKRDTKSSSMEFFLRVLERELYARSVNTEIIYPTVFFGKLKVSSRFLKKALGFLDKIILFPCILKWRLHRLSKQSSNVIVHIVDQGYSNYCKYLKNIPHVVTCHDLLSLQATMGEFSERREAFATRIYQRMMLNGLKNATLLVAVSEYTSSTVKRLTGLPSERIRVVQNGLHYPYQPMEQRYRKSIISSRISRYILHVGINIWYKNRPAVIEIFRNLNSMKGFEDMHLIMVGQPITDEMQSTIEAYGLTDRIHIYCGIEHEHLRALYSFAEGLLFPSLREGFGWPIIEAQACGCPVFTSNRAPMNQIAGSNAITFDPLDALGAAKIIAAQFPLSPYLRESAIENASQYTTERMIDGYLSIYREFFRFKFSKRSSPTLCIKNRETVSMTV